jgi:GNAT superfamily N-acetyltransferase
MTASGLVVRAAEEAELGRIVELFALGAVPGGAPSTEDPDDLGPYRAAWRAIVDGGNGGNGGNGDNGGVVLVAVLAGEVVGVCQLIVFRHLQAHGGLCAELESVHVHPDHRGTGVGAALLREAIVRARALGCYRVQLTSNTGRPDAHRFYERLGFVPSHVGFKLLLQSAATIPLDHRT